METHSNFKYQFGEFILDAATQTLKKKNGEILPLNSRAFNTLLALVERQGQTLSKHDLLTIVWPNSIVEENNLNQAVSHLRKALGDSINQSRFIRTIPRRGFCFVSPVSIENSEADNKPNIGQQPSTDAVVYEDSESGKEITTKTLDAGKVEKAKPQRLRWQWLMAASLILISGGGILSIWLWATSDLPPSPSASQSWFADTIVPSASQETPLNLMPNSVAVLPFTILNPGSTEDTLFATGLHDELINKLTQISSLNVISRENIIALENLKGPRDIASLYGVESVITGNIQYAENKARISVQMAKSVNGMTIWAESYETDMLNLQDMISLQSDIATNVASALEAKVEEEERSSIASLPTESFEAYRYMLAARQAYFEQELNATWELTHMALEHDPDYEDAMFLFSSVNVLLAGRPRMGFTSSEHYQLAWDYADKLIAENPLEAEGHVLKAAAMTSAGDWLGVHRELQNLERIQATPEKLHILGSFFMSTGNFAKAIEVYQANLITEPVNFFDRGFLLAALELAGRRNESRTEYAIGEELSPQWWGDSINIVLALGRNEPITDSNYLSQLSNRLSVLLENPEEKDPIINRIHTYLENRNTRSTEAIYLAALAANIEEHDLAVELMRFAVKDVWLSFFFLWLPVFDETRTTDDFQSLLLESGLVEYWNATSWPEMCSPTAEGIICDWKAYPD